MISQFGYTAAIREKSDDPFTHWPSAAQTGASLSRNRGLVLHGSSGADGARGARCRV